jgi:hypothetical protein
LRLREPRRQRSSTSFIGATENNHATISLARHILLYYVIGHGSSCYRSKCLETRISQDLLGWL